MPAALRTEVRELHRRDLEPGGAANDALLITYGDTLFADGAPLAALREFAARHLEGRINGIHLPRTTVAEVGSSVGRILDCMVDRKSVV